MKKTAYLSYLKMRVCCFACLVLLFACTPIQPVGVNTLPELKRLSVDSVKESTDKKMSPIREQAMQDVALSLGAQAGLAVRAKQINTILDRQDKHLVQTFNFNLLLLPHNVLPPVLVEGREMLKLDDENTIRLADRTYKILKQARFVTAPPTWRDYLWLSYKNPEPPHHSLLPDNRIEQRVWDKFVTQGWEEGVRQADTIFAENLARLKEEYQGMILYRSLLTQGMVSAPFVGRSELGITGDSSNLRVNDQVLRITALPALQMNSQRWQPAAVSR
ncbi:MAG: type IV secretion system DotC family protein [Gammaproteobacteria bacterium]|nr:type IV secretion system DotC family protein [Gammaproteobacteria bacterium]